MALWGRITTSAALIYRPNSLSGIKRKSTGLIPMDVLGITRDNWELLSFIVTALGLPMAIGVFIYEQHRERDNEEENVYQLLSDNYQDFLKVALDNADLRLFAEDETPALSAEQQERRLIIFSMLISLFERSYLLLFEDHMTEKQRRRWSSWEDYMGEWLSRSDFRSLLGTLLRGEDPGFATYIQQLAAQQPPSQQSPTEPPPTK